MRVLFTDKSDKCRATLDGTDGWGLGWILCDHSPPVGKARQQERGGIMFWAAIFDGKLIGLFRVKDGVKVNVTTHSAFLDEHFQPWWKKQALRLRKIPLLMHFLIWPPYSLDLKPTENLWSMLKKDL